MVGGVVLCVGFTGLCSSLPPESPAVCPNCGSDHVVLLALTVGAHNGEQRQEEQLPASLQSPSTVHNPPGDSDHSTRADSTPSQGLVSQDCHRWSLSPRECRQNKTGLVLGEGKGAAGAGGEMAPCSQGRLMAHCLSPAPERCGFRSVDHRLRLFLDVEVFTDAQEEFQCCIKVCASLALPCP